MLTIFQGTLQFFLKAWKVLIWSHDLVTAGPVNPAETAASVHCTRHTAIQDSPGMSNSVQWDDLPNLLSPLL